jgi:hypothetical protein
MGPCWDCTVHDAEEEAVEQGSHILVPGTAQAMALASTPGIEMMEQERDHASRVDIDLEVLEIRLCIVLVVLERGRANKADTEREALVRLLLDGSGIVLVVLETGRVNRVDTEREAPVRLLLHGSDIVLVGLEMAPASRARTGLPVLETDL